MEKNFICQLTRIEFKIWKVIIWLYFWEVLYHWEVMGWTSHFQKKKELWHAHAFEMTCRESFRQTGTSLTQLTGYTWITKSKSMMLTSVFSWDDSKRFFNTPRRDFSQSGIKLPIWHLPLCPPDEAAKIPIYMNFRLCQNLKPVFRSLQTLALSKFTTESDNQSLLDFRNSWVCLLND